MCAMRRAYRRGVSTLQYTGRLETQRRCMAMLPYIYNPPAVAECAKIKPKKTQQQQKNPDDYTPPLHAFTSKIRSVSCALVHLFILHSFVYFALI